MVAVRCFVIGPIGNRFAPVGDPARQTYEDSLQVLEDVIQAACQKVGLDPIRADQIAVAGEITEQVFRHIYEDEIVIADVSGGNPNVMYELGLRHTTGKLTIQIGEFGQLPFDLNTIRTIQFSRSPRGIIDARNELEKALQAGLLEGQDPLTAARLWQQVNEPSLESVDLALGEVDNSPGLLDSVAELEGVMVDMAEDANSIGAAIEAIGMATEAVGVKMGEAARSNASGSARLALIARYAGDIKEPVDDLETHATGFAERIGSINDGVLAMLKLIELSDQSAQPEGAQEFIDQLIGVAEASRESMEGLNSFGSAAEGMGAMSRQLRGPGKKISTAVQSMRAAMAMIDDWERAARSVRVKQ
ncbi:hypothetical protein ACWGA0_26410 [Streptomyces erythrochromogenes]